MERIARIIIICIGVFGLILLGMYLYGLISGWLEVFDDDSVSVNKAHLIHHKLDNMKNPIIKAGYEKGINTNSSYVWASLDARLDDLDAARYRLEAVMGW